ncbi:hypothetical protein [Vallitalea guaymasensis]|uniref:hypothetical protein n=1 Tax=Vallitalea guaymasensis TaxID=1185412 RepID=UPI000DE2148A|nr:hypothetical protein [Vallitalea guaymasensis]
MNKKEKKFISNIVDNLAAIPKAHDGTGGATSKAIGHIKASQDFGNAVNLACVAIKCMMEVDEYKCLLSREDVDINDINKMIQENKKKSREAYKELNRFISERKDNNWS